MARDSLRLLLFILSILIYRGQEVSSSQDGEKTIEEGTNSGISSRTTNKSDTYETIQLHDSYITVTNDLSNNFDGSEEVDQDIEQQIDSSMPCATLAQIDLPSYPIRIVFSIIYGLILPFGLIGNMLTLYVMMYKKTPLSILDIFIGNLAISDILLCAFSVPVSPINALYYGYWIFGRFFCLFYSLSLSSSVYSSTLTMICIAYYRYQLIVTSHRTPMTKGKAFIMCGSTWLFALIITLPYLMHIDIHPADCPIRFCDEEWGPTIKRIHFTIFTMAIQLLLPIASASFFYGSIFWKLNKQEKLRKRRWRRYGNLPNGNCTNTNFIRSPTGVGQLLDPNRCNLVSIHESRVRRFRYPFSSLVRQRNSEFVIAYGSREYQVTNEIEKADSLPVGNENQRQPRVGHRVSSPTISGNAQQASDGNKLEDIDEPQVSQCELSGFSEPICLGQLDTCIIDVLSPEPRSPDYTEGEVINEMAPIKRALRPDKSVENDWLCESQEVPGGNIQQQHQLKRARSDLAARHSFSPENPSAKFLFEASGSANQLTKFQRVKAAAEHQQRQVPDFVLAKEEQIRLRNKRMTSTNIKLYSIIGLFVISWAPLNLFNSFIDLMEITHDTPGTRLIFIVVQTFASLSVCYNPVLYAWMSENYRQELINVLPSRLVSILRWSKQQQKSLDKNNNNNNNNNNK